MTDLANNPCIYAPDRCLFLGASDQSLYLDRTAFTFRRPAKYLIRAPRIPRTYYSPSRYPPYSLTLMPKSSSPSDVFWVAAVAPH